MTPAEIDALDEARSNLLVYMTRYLPDITHREIERYINALVAAERAEAARNQWDAVELNKLVSAAVEEATRPYRMAARALRGILEIGKRDMSNPKYDGYFEEARAALNLPDNGGR